MKKKYNLSHLVPRRRSKRLVFIVRLSMVLLISVMVSSVNASPVKNDNIPGNAIMQQKVTGTVTDASTGEPLPGVSVQVEGTSIGTITDIKGKYSIEAPKDAILSFSFVGFTTERVSVTGLTLDVKLKAEARVLDEVVVVGYGVQRKEAITGSVASIKGDIVRDIPSADMTQALQGRVAGVEMTQTSSQPGASMQIRIRGTRSLNASNDPLVVLDGIPYPGSISDINPNDIKSIDILKDASATAIYGSRGSNG
ncbi:MAG TPA: carboxypeptidase-like regulatory domain-containing protein, partial [Bacteroidales bacterium]